MFPAVPADEVENHLCDHHNDHQRERKEKTLVLLRYTIGKQMLCLFFCLQLYYQVIQMPKKAFCLGSITKCHVTRYGGGLQSRAKQSSHLKTPSCGFFIMGQWSCLSLEFRFTCVLGGRQTPQDGLQGVDGICDASLASRDCTLSTGGSTRELGTV